MSKKLYALVYLDEDTTDVPPVHGEPEVFLFSLTDQEYVEAVQAVEGTELEGDGEHNHYLNLVEVTPGFGGTLEALRKTLGQVKKEVDHFADEEDDEDIDPDIDAAANSLGDDDTDPAVELECRLSDDLQWSAEIKGNLVVILDNYGEEVQPDQLSEGLPDFEMSYVKDTPMCRVPVVVAGGVSVLFDDNNRRWRPVEDA